MKKGFFVLSLTVVLSLVSSVTAFAEWVVIDDFLRFKKADGSYIKNDALIWNNMWFYFDESGNLYSMNTPYNWIDEQEKKIQHICDVFTQINSRNDLQIIPYYNFTDYADNGILVKAVFKNDYYLKIPIVECYYENNQLIFAYATDGVNEYRYYFEDLRLIREIGPNGVFDYLYGDGLEKTGDPEAKEIFGRGQWETALFAEDYWGTG